MKKFSAEYLGEEFIWWMGKVESVSDPLKLGRAQVRIFNWYGDKIETKDLPWAQPLQPITSSAKHGVGTSPTGMEIGTWVMGFFLDGHAGQRPVIMGTIAGIPDDVDPVEPDVNRLARNDPAFEDEPALPPPNPATKDEDLTENVPTAAGNSWSEPKSAYKAEYPHNKTITTKSGHIFEVDDTEDEERIHEYHKTGTFYEIDKDGTKVTRLVFDNYVIIARDNYCNIKGDCKVTIDSDAETYIKGDYTLRVDGDKTEIIGGNVNETVSGKQTTSISKGLKYKASRIDLN